MLPAAIVIPNAYLQVRKLSSNKIAGVNELLNKRFKIKTLKLDAVVAES